MTRQTGQTVCNRHIYIYISRFSGAGGISLSLSLSLSLIIHVYIPLHSLYRALLETEFSDVDEAWGIKRSPSNLRTLNTLMRTFLFLVQRQNANSFSAVLPKGCEYNFMPIVHCCKKHCCDYSNILWIELHIR